MQADASAVLWQVLEYQDAVAGAIEPLGMGQAVYGVGAGVREGERERRERDKRLDSPCALHAAPDTRLYSWGRSSVDARRQVLEYQDAVAGAIEPLGMGQATARDCAAASLMGYQPIYLYIYIYTYIYTYIYVYIFIYICICIYIYITYIYTYIYIYIYICIYI